MIKIIFMIFISLCSLARVARAREDTIGLKKSLKSFFSGIFLFTQQFSSFRIFTVSGRVEENNFLGAAIGRQGNSYTVFGTSDARTNRENYFSQVGWLPLSVRSKWQNLRLRAVA
jgi:hypothetical protein